MSRVDLDAAVAAGLLAADQVGPLDAFLSARVSAPTQANPPSVPQGEEDLRFIRNFHDVFLAIGIALLTVGLWIGGIIFVGQGAYRFDTHESPEVFWRAALVFAGAAGVMWALGEIFARQRRLFLPSIAICLAFAGFVAVVALSLYGAVWFKLLAASARDGNAAFDFAQVRALALMAAAGGVLAAGLFYWRFRLPFSLGLTGSLIACLIGAAVFVIEPALLARILSPMMLAIGIGLFLAGVAFDARDPARASRFSDNGFWLHMAAAPLILNGALGCVANIIAPNQSSFALFAGGGAGPAMAVATLFVVTALAIVSLLINRRALIVSALLTTGIAVGVLMKAAGFDAAGLAAATLLTLGVGVLTLGAGWHKVRAAFLARVRPQGVWARVFPPESSE